MHCACCVIELVLRCTNFHNFYFCSLAGPVLDLPIVVVPRRRSVTAEVQVHIRARRTHEDSSNTVEAVVVNHSVFIFILIFLCKSQWAMLIAFHNHKSINMPVA